jgi:hypothetical protein
MQGGRRNTGFKTTPMGGMQSTRLSSASQPTAGTYRRHEWGATDVQPQRVARPAPGTRPEAATPQGTPRSGSRVVTEAGHEQLIQIGTETGTPPQTIAPPKVVQSG